MKIDLVYIAKQNERILDELAAMRTMSRC